MIVMGGPGYIIDQVLGKQILQRATNTFHHKEPIQYYFIAVPLAWLPWTLALIGAPFYRLLQADFWAGMWRNRHRSEAIAYSWIMAISTFAFLSSLSGKVLVYILPMFPPLALITSDALSRWEAPRVKRTFLSIGILFAVLGTVLLFGSDLAPVPVPIMGAGIAGGVLLACAAILWLLRNKGFKAGLLFMPLAVTLWLIPVGTLVAPSLDNAMSPRHQALKLKHYADQGYRPMAWKIYSGIFSYYAGHDLYESNHWDDVAAQLAQQPKAALIVREKHWDELKDKPLGLIQIDRQYISGEPYLLLLKNGNS
jgi:4-amino-4-deoxy-L-arabinose transferase-like glycosyltransferase